MAYYKRKTGAQRRRERVRSKLRRVAEGRPRLSIHRSGKHLYHILYISSYILLFI